MPIEVSHPPVATGAAGRTATFRRCPAVTGQLADRFGRRISDRIRFGPPCPDEPIQIDRARSRALARPHLRVAYLQPQAHERREDDQRAIPPRPSEPCQTTADTEDVFLGPHPPARRIGLDNGQRDAGPSGGTARRSCVPYVPK